MLLKKLHKQIVTLILLIVSLSLIYEFYGVNSNKIIEIRRTLNNISLNKRLNESYKSYEKFIEHSYEKEVLVLYKKYSPYLIISVRDEKPVAFFNHSISPFILVHIVKHNELLSIQYWFYYRKSIHPLHEHQHDWELFYIVFGVNNSMYIPLIAGYGEHGIIHTVTWNKVVKINNTHPVIYIATGSHAIYPCNISDCKMIWDTRLDKLEYPIQEISHYHTLIVEKVSIDNRTTRFFDINGNETLILRKEYRYFGEIKAPWLREVWDQILSNRYDQ